MGYYLSPEEAFLKAARDGKPGFLFEALISAESLGPGSALLGKGGWRGLIVTLLDLVHDSTFDQVQARPAVEDGFVRDDAGVWRPSVSIPTVVAKIGAACDALILDLPDLLGTVPRGWEPRAVLIRHCGRWEEISNGMLLRGYQTLALDSVHICLGKHPLDRRY